MAKTSMQNDDAAFAVGGLSALAASCQQSSTSVAPAVDQVLQALREFDECVRYLNTRRSAGAVINIRSEADVQDVLYLLLRPWVTDLIYESPADKTGSRYVIKDFSSTLGKFVIDAKYIRNKEHGKLISKELHDDIEMYRTHPHCNYLIFFIYDPDVLIPDQRALREAIEIQRAYGSSGEKRLACHLIVKP